MNEFAFKYKYNCKYCSTKSSLQNLHLPAPRKGFIIIYELKSISLIGKDLKRKKETMDSLESNKKMEYFGRCGTK